MNAAPVPAPTREQQSELARRAMARWSDPVVFADEVLRTKMWSRQREVVRAVAEHPRVAIRSGHKVGKSTSFAALALWWCATKPRARVILTAASYRQVDAILWREIRRLYNRARWPLGGELHEKPESGLQVRDGREIVGFSTKEPERMAGFSGPNMLFLVDEASGVPDPIFEAIEGNRAGGAHIAMISNPTQTSGYYYDAFTSERSTWHCVAISSEECAQVAPGELGNGTGLATPEWVEEKRLEWGEDDPRFQVRVRGNFPTQGDDAMVSTSLVEEAKARWFASSVPTGKLQIGVDVARFGTDSTAIVWSRGKWASSPTRLRGKDAVDVAGEVRRIARELAHNGERPSVRVDTTGMGGGVADILRRDDTLELVEVDASASATVEGFSRMRDQVWGSAKEWLKQGGALPRDAQLTADLTAPKYTFDVRGDLKVESKLDLRKRIGRSTDVADAFALSVFASRERAWTPIIGSRSTRDESSYHRRA